jgi:molybdopterin-binding protein
MLSWAIIDNIQHLSKSFYFLSNVSAVLLVKYRADVTADVPRAGKVVQSSMENLFRGTIVRINDLSVLDTGKIKMEIISARQGEAHAAVNPKDILVSHQPLSTSARNCFPGIITEVIHEGAAVRLSVTAGEVFKVLMTRASFQEMKLDVGTKVYIAFKSTAVEIL